MTNGAIIKAKHANMLIVVFSTKHGMMHKQFEGSKCLTSACEDRRFESTLLTDKIILSLQEKIKAGHKINLDNRS